MRKAVHVENEFEITSTTAETRVSIVQNHDPELPYAATDIRTLQKLLKMAYEGLNRYANMDLYKGKSPRILLDEGEIARKILVQLHEVMTKE